MPCADAACCILVEKQCATRNSHKFLKQLESLVALLLHARTCKILECNEWCSCSQQKALVLQSSVWWNACAVHTFVHAKIWVFTFSCWAVQNLHWWLTLAQQQLHCLGHKCWVKWTTICHLQFPWSSQHYHTTKIFTESNWQLLCCTMCCTLCNVHHLNFDCMSHKKCLNLSKLTLFGQSPSHIVFCLVKKCQAKQCNWKVHLVDFWCRFGMKQLAIHLCTFNALQCFQNIFHSESPHLKMQQNWVSLCFSRIVVDSKLFNNHYWNSECLNPLEC